MAKMKKEVKTDSPLISLGASFTDVPETAVIEAATKAVETIGVSEATLESFKVMEDGICVVLHTDTRGFVKVHVPK